MVMINIWKTFGKLLENFWKQFGKHLENTWKTFGKHLNDDDQDRNKDSSYGWYLGFEVEPRMDEKEREEEKRKEERDLSGRKRLLEKIGSFGIFQTKTNT